MVGFAPWSRKPWGNAHCRLWSSLTVHGDRQPCESDTSMAADELEDIRKELAEVRARNLRVEREKAWETSWARRLVIAGATWVGAWLWLLGLGAEHAALQALVPSGAYTLSTLSLPVLKRVWMRLRFGPK